MCANAHPDHRSFCEYRKMVYFYCLYCGHVLEMHCFLFYILVRYLQDESSVLYIIVHTVNFNYHSMPVNCL